MAGGGSSGGGAAVPIPARRNPLGNVEREKVIAAR